MPRSESTNDLANSNTLVELVASNGGSGGTTGGLGVSTGSLLVLLEDERDVEEAADDAN